jgi:hypothetical protein
MDIYLSVGLKKLRVEKNVEKEFKKVEGVQGGRNSKAKGGRQAATIASRSHSIATFFAHYT